MPAAKPSNSAVQSGTSKLGQICWLHLSDIHFWGKNDWKDDAARRKLIAMLEKKFANGELPKPDLIFCTGDIAQGETKPDEMQAQYESAKTFFDQVLQVCGLQKSRLFVVPGNHDVNRSRVSKKFQTALRETDYEEIKNDWAAANAEFSQCMQRQEEYAAFVQSYMPHQAVSDEEKLRHCYSKTMTINGVRLGIAGFNSAWTCFDDKDQNQLWMAAEWQFNSADKAFAGKTDVCIGLIHHPISWLKTQEASLSKQRIRSSFQFFLHGHEHEAWVTPTKKETVICAGAVNASSDSEFGINLVDLNLTEGHGKVHLFSYQTGGNAWLKKVLEDAEDGVWELNPKPIHLTKFENSASLSEPKRVAGPNIKLQIESEKNAISTVSTIDVLVSKLENRLHDDDLIGLSKKKIQSTESSTHVTALFPEKTVFISYAWESDEFREKVRALVTWLRAQNVKVVADFDHANRPPSVGWPSWMQHSIEDATVVLVICSPKYKLRFEKRASPDSGKGVTWEGAVITQDLYDAAQRNDKVYPIFLDPVNFEDVPKALQPWYNGHSFPAKQAGILALVLECFDAATPESKLVTPTTTSININGAPPSEPPPVVEPLPSNAERISQCHASILGLLNQSHFAAFPQLSFAENGMPQIIEDVFSAPSMQTERKIIAERLLIAIRAFAKQFVAQFNELAGDSVLRVERSKNQFWKRFVNAMQMAILLSAKQNTASRERVAQAYNPDQPCEIAGMSWLSVSVLLREDLAESLRSNVIAPGAMDDPLRDNYAGDASEIELGTGPGAKIQLCKALKYILDGGSFPEQASQGQIEALAGQLNLHKVDGKPVLLITQQTGKYGPEILRWLNHEMEVGHAIVLACNGEFELIEGRWRAYLVDLLKQLRDFEPATIQ